MKSNPLIFNPPVIAHRGASGYAPENTIAAFTKAAQLGVKWIEFDVLPAACGKPVIIHNETLNKTTNGTGKVYSYPYDFLQSLDAGSWFDPIFSGEKIPSLLQVIDFLQNTKLNANIEIKPSVNDELLVKQVIKEMSPFLKTTSSQILFSSFSFEILQLLRKQCPRCQLGLLLHDWEPNWMGMCESLQCVSIHVNDKILTRDAAITVKSAGKALLCYTVNDVLRAKELFEWGVDAVFSDFPDKILDGLGLET